MESKRTKFSPNSIEQAEKEIIDRLIGNEDRYAVPSDFRGRVQTTWDSLVAAFPAPIAYTVPLRVGQTGLNRASFDCFLPPSFNCSCYKCTTIMYPEVEMYHRIMDDKDLEESAESPTLVNVAQYPHDMDRGIYPVLDCILNVAHFYADYVYVPGTATLDLTPSTPTFSRVLCVTSPMEDDRRR